uniref:Uncharacterized protein n=1 Tax=viral metagenome TaxID=1070528 RepID=A0A6C0KRU7_9ZZZZ
MIYLIITTSLHNRYGSSINRDQQYQSAIREILAHLPETIQPIIVENNGLRPTFLDHFIHVGKPVPVMYTDHNETRKSKGMKEVLDIQYVIRQYGIDNNDMVIKVTGRYRVTSSLFFQEVINYQEHYDAFIKFYGVSSLSFNPNESVLGLYAMRAYLLLWWHPTSIDLSSSAEVAFAKYAKRSCSRIKEIEYLGLTCIFAEDGRILDV